jgi:hypothetical protein
MYFFSVKIEIKINWRSERYFQDLPNVKHAALLHM